MTLEYFEIMRTLNYREVGNVSTQVNIDRTYIAETDVARRIINKPISPDVIFRFNLEKKTIATDVLSQGDITSSGLLISKRIYDSIKELCIEHVQFIDSRVKKGNEELRYYWLHPTQDYFDYIDYSKTTFVLTEKSTGHILYEMKFKNKEVLLQRLYNKKTDKALTDKDGIFFMPGYSLKSHFIFLPRIDISLYISKTMKDILIANAITGALITEEATNMICE